MRAKPLVFGSRFERRVTGLRTTGGELNRNVAGDVSVSESLLVLLPVL